ncbi:MAG: 50S ribosomal protein L4 [Zetaproteobacteria bacterium]|nr:MAG: 50S ribosomal protein L4 [Zetaproteobacteria bacterium]
MAEIRMVDQNNNEVGVRRLSDAVFGLEPDPGLVHRVYTALALAQRSGCHHTKTRAEVSGGGRKPWRQKGTGRARQGSTRAPQWRHGGVAHGPRAHGWSRRVNRKERRLAMRYVLSDLFRSGRLVVVDRLQLDAPKTKAFAAVTTALGAENGLFVLGGPDRNVELSGRNLPRCEVVLEGQLNLHRLLKHERVVLTDDAVRRIEERLA